MIATATPAGPRSWTRALRDHDAAIATFVGVADAIPDDRWHVPPAPGKWSPAEEVLHVALSYQVALAGVRTGARMHPPGVTDPCALAAMAGAAGDAQLLSQNELDAARTVRLDHFNPQMQVRFTWPPSFALARAYVDQLERSRGLSPARIATVRRALQDAESMSGSGRRTALTQLQAQVYADAAASSDGEKVRMLSAALRDLAAM